jgi:hypothetical protein
MRERTKENNAEPSEARQVGYTNKSMAFKTAEKERN